MDKVVNNDEMIPTKFHLSQCYPNPFKEKTKIKYCIAYKTNVKIDVLTKEGKLIENLIDEVKSEGTYEIEFNAYTNKTGKSRNLSEGRYKYALETPDYREVKEMIIAK